MLNHKVTVIVALVLAVVLVLDRFFNINPLVHVALALWCWGLNQLHVVFKK